MANLQDAVNGYLDSLTPFTPTMINDLLMEKGGNAGIAMELSGTSDKKSKGYKAAIRWVQYYFKGQREGKPKKVSDTYKKKIRNTPTIKNLAANETGPVRIDLKATVKISQDERKRDWHGDDAFELSAREAKDFFKAVLHNEPLIAWAILFNANGIPSPDRVSDESLDIHA